MSKSTTTYIRKSDGKKVEVIMEPQGWPGHKKVNAGPITLPNGTTQDVYRVSDEQFLREYELPKGSLFRSFFKGIIR